jgi:hypothetical protein
VRIYLGIDPGKTGAIAVLNEDGALVCTHAMPNTVADLVHLLRPYGDEEARAVLERVQVWAGNQMGKGSCFEFGRGYGRLEAALAAAFIPFDLVQPAKWQGVLSCLSKGNKNITKARAQGLFPRATVTHAIADALLIAEYCRRLHRGKHVQEEAGHPSTETGQTSDRSTGPAQAGRSETTRSASPRRRRADTKDAHQGQDASAADTRQRVRAGRQ